MTGVELILLVIGSIFMVGSFFITEKLSPSELNKIAELSENELNKIIEQGLKRADARIVEAIDEQIDASSESVERALEKETNAKIMAISEYSDTVVESMNKTHNEIMFLYSMLNDKHAELTGMVSDLQKLAADVRDMQEKAKVQMPLQPQRMVQPQGQAVPPRRSVQPAQRPGTPAQANPSAEPQKSAKTVTQAKPLTEEKPQKAEAQPEDEKNSSNREILRLHKEGLTEIQIARKLGLGIGEVRLVIGLYRGEKDS